MSSFLIRDRLGPSVAVSNQRLAVWRRFNAVWPHDKALYDEKLYYYENGKLIDTPEFRKFLNIIGLKFSDLEDQEYDEIESCWFYLKAPALKYAIYSPTEMIIAMRMDRPMQGDRHTIKFSYAGNLKVIIPGDLYQVTNTTVHYKDVNYNQTQAMTGTEIQTAIMSDPGKYVMSQMPRQVSGTRNEYMYSEEKPYDRRVHLSPENQASYQKSISKLYEKPVCQITCSTKYGWYSVFDIGFETFEITRMSPATLMASSTGYGLEWTVEYRAKKTLFPQDKCMVEFSQMFNERVDLPKANGSLPYRTTETDFRENYTATDPNLWPDGRLSVPNSNSMKRLDFVDMMATMIDTDYKVEDPSLWEKAVAAVIVVAAVVVTIFSMGSLAGMAWPAALAAISFAFAMGAIVLGVGSMLLGYFGGPSAMSMVKVIAGVAQFMGLVASVLGIFSFISRFMKSLTAEAIMKKATKQASVAASAAGSKSAGKIASEQVMNEAIELANSSIYERAATSIFESLSSSLSFAGNSIVETGQKLTSWMQGTFTIYRFYDENFGEMADLRDDNEELADELAALNEENANSKMMVMGQDVYSYSLGSFDAIAELNVKIEKQCGGWYADQDQCASIT